LTLNGGNGFSVPAERHGIGGSGDCLGRIIFFDRNLVSAFCSSLLWKGVPDMNLTGKRALVTGSSRGIGRAIALRLGEAGARVWVNSWNDREGAEDTVRLLREMGRESFQTQADVSLEEDVETLLGKVRDTWGGPDILVNNAGISGAGGSLFDINGETWDRMIHVNLKSVFLCSRAALPAMLEARYGRIVNIASVAGISGALECNAHYAAAKGGIAALTRRLARDFASCGVTVNCIAPGLILDTGFNERMSQQRIDFYVQRIPRGRPGYTRDVAGLAAFLASYEADYITGQVIAVDGGATC